MADINKETLVKKLTDIADGFRTSRSLTSTLSLGEMAELAAVPIGSAENKFNQLFKKTITEVTAEDLEGVTVIKERAFYDCVILKDVTIPNTVTEIGSYAFYNCSSLTDITMESGTALTKMGDYTFNECSSLVSFIVPHGFSWLGNYTFYECTELKSITIPNDIEKINQNCFMGCEKLENVYYDGDIASWCNIAFSHPTSNPIYYAGTIYTKNANGTYEMITNLVIPNTVKEIKQYAFYYGKKITYATIPESVTTIRNNALQIGESSNKATIRFLGTTPPTIQSSTIGNYVKKIIVPKGCGDVYKSATNFSAKANIIEEETE